jgi:type VI secretion system secreted protein VgrG
MPAPYPLPAHQTKTVLRTKSTGDGDGHNEISFEDQKGEEAFYMRAERRMEKLVRGDEGALVQGSRSRMVGKDEHIAVRGNRHDHVYGDEHRIVDGDKRTEIGGSTSITVHGDVSVDVQGTLSLRVGGRVIVVAVADLLLAAADATMRSDGAFVRATAGTTYASPFVDNVGAPGAGNPNAPAMPAPPTLPAAYQTRLPHAKVRLPVIAWPRAIPPIGSVPDEEIICRFVCECKDARNKRGDRRTPQACLSQNLALYEKAARGVTRIWAEVPYNMAEHPPAPITSRNEPWRGTGRKPAGSRIPDVVLVKDPSKPPTQDNIDKVIEVKFPPDDWAEGQERAYTRIAGSAPVEKWGPDWPCYCSDRKEPEPAKAPDDVVVAGGIALLILALLLDDLVGGFADDAAIPPLVVELVKRLGPVLKPGLITP